MTARKKRPPDTLVTRAKKSASHLAKKGTRTWDILYELALKRLHILAEAERALEEDNNHDS